MIAGEVSKMEPRKELTKELIASSMKEIMLHQPFEKITIRMITEHAGIIRPTFYYHFQDKYEVLEWIVRHELVISARMLMERGLIDEAIHVVFADIEKNREFYRRAFHITGQNNFAGIMTEQTKALLTELISFWGVTAGTGLRMLTDDMLCTYCATNFVSMVFIWVTNEHDQATADDMTESFLYLIRHSYTDCFRKKDDGE